MSQPKVSVHFVPSNSLPCIILSALSLFRSATKGSLYLLACNSGFGQLAALRARPRVVCLVTSSRRGLATPRGPTRDVAGSGERESTRAHTPGLFRRKFGTSGFFWIRRRDFRWHSFRHARVHARTRARTHARTHASTIRDSTRIPRTRYTQPRRKGFKSRFRLHRIFTEMLAIANASPENGRIRFGRDGRIVSRRYTARGQYLGLYPRPEEYQFTLTLSRTFFPIHIRVAYLSLRVNGNL